MTDVHAWKKKNQKRVWWPTPQLVGGVIDSARKVYTRVGLGEQEWATSIVRNEGGSNSHSTSSFGDSLFSSHRTGAKKQERYPQETEEKVESGMSSDGCNAEKSTKKVSQVHISRGLAFQNLQEDKGDDKPREQINAQSVVQLFHGGISSSDTSSGY